MGNWRANSPSWPGIDTSMWQREVGYTCAVVPRKAKNSVLATEEGSIYGHTPPQGVHRRSASWSTIFNGELPRRAAARRAAASQGPFVHWAIRPVNRNTAAEQVPP